MKVTDHLRNAEGPLFSFEILPPLKGKSIQSIFDGIDPLMEFGPKFINVTYHREEYIYKERDHGLLEKIAIRKRPGTVGICAAIYLAEGCQPITCHQVKLVVGRGIPSRHSVHQISLSAVL